VEAILWAFCSVWNAIHGQSFPQPRTVRRSWFHPVQNLFSFCSFAVLTVEQSTPRPHHSSLSSAHNQVFLFIFWCLPCGQSVVVVNRDQNCSTSACFRKIERRTVRPSTPDSPVPMYQTVWVSHADSPCLSSKCCFHLVFRGLGLLLLWLIHCTSRTSPRVSTHLLGRDLTALLCVGFWVVILRQRLKVLKKFWGSHSPCLVAIFGPSIISD
jgi:hypothetical protein